MILNICEKKHVKTIFMKISLNTLRYKFCDNGTFNNYVDRILPFFDPPPHLLSGQFLYPERGQKQTFFDPLSPLSCPRTYSMDSKDKHATEKLLFSTV